MKSKRALLLAIGLFFASGHARPFAQTPERWQLSSNAAGGYAVLVPGPLQAREPTTDKGGTAHTFVTNMSGMVYIVAYSDISYDLTNVPKELDAARDAFVQGIKASLVSEHRFLSLQPVGQVMASEFVCQSAEQECRARTYFYGKRRGYMIAVVNRRGSGSLSDSARFLDSFQIVTPR